MKGRNLVNGSAACNSFFHYNGTHRGVCGNHACTGEREFLGIVVDGHDDHVSKIIEDDARRLAPKPTAKRRLDPAVNKTLRGIYPPVKRNLFARAFVNILRKLPRRSFNIQITGWYHYIKISEFYECPECQNYICIFLQPLLSSVPRISE